eukprot:m.317426 g.317426  ORF g.317426 m.317426 type:complete len:54 (+) comp16434_c0_seq14:448-609(+)
MIKKGSTSIRKKGLKKSPMFRLNKKPSRTKGDFQESSQLYFLGNMCTPSGDLE